jgi:hypothetical protein
MRGLLAFCVLLSMNLPAQTERGTISGRVLDPTSATVPDARVEATNQATGVRSATRTNDAGVYSIQQLPPGRYDLSVESAGFRRYSHTNIDLNVAQTLTLDVALEVGETVNTVEVTSAPPAIESSTSDLSTVVDSHKVMELPLSVSGNMRNPEQFVFLAPGVTGDAVNTQINGSQSRAKEILIDGVSASSPESGGTLFTYPSIEAFQEFKLVSGNFNAEYGHTGGGFEVFVTKSGTNNLHGAVFDYLRNDVLDARGFFSTATPINRQNEFGAALGGPVWVPKVYNGRNRTFFYFVYSGFRFRQGATNALTSVPPLDFLKGDFSRLVDRNGNQVPIYDPRTTSVDANGNVTRAQFSGNKIPADRFSSVAKAILPLFPAPINSGILNNFLTVGAKTFDRDQVDLKIDHRFSDRSSASFFLYLGTQTTIDAPNLPPPLSNALDEDRLSRWARFSHDFIFSPSALNHFALGFTREGQYWRELSVNQDWPAKLGLQGVNTGAGNTFPIVTFTGGYNILGGGGIASPALFTTPSGVNPKSTGSQVNNVWQMFDSISWIRGNHSFKFGADLRLMQTNGADFFLSQGRFDFNSLETAFPSAAGRASTGNSFASFLLGAVDKGSLNVLAVVPGNRYHSLGAFVQDDWKISRKLTLNLGLRYDLFFPRTESHNNLSGFDPSLPNPGAGGRLGAIAFLGNGPGRNGRGSFADTDYRAFGPRVGFAYQLNVKTVARGGYGVFYEQGNATAGLRTSQSFGFGFNAAPVFQTLDAGVTPAFNWDNGFPQNFSKPPRIDPTVANGSDVNYIGRGDGRPPYIQNWTIDIQRDLGWNAVADVAYVGNKGTRLGTALFNLNELDPRFLSLGNLLTLPVTSPQAIAAGIPLPYAGFKGSVAQALRPYPQYTNIVERSNPNGNSTYHALQAKLEKRLAAGFTFLAAYTWSKSISDSDIQAGGGPSGQTYYNRKLEKAVSTNDVPQNVALSYLYELPFGPGKRFLRNPGVASRIFGGWTVTAIHHYFSGKPIVLTANNTLPLFNGVLRPNVNAGVTKSLPFHDPATDRYINPAAFSVPAQFTFGTSARSYTDLRAPFTLDESFGLIKNTVVFERLTLQFRAEFFNVFNRVVFDAPAANVSNANFGQITSQANRPRQGQLALRLEF